MSDAPLLAERPYLFKIGASTVPGTVTRIKYALNIDTMEHLQAGMAAESATIMADIPNYTDSGNGTILISEIKISV